MTIYGDALPIVVCFINEHEESLIPDYRHICDLHTLTSCKPKANAQNSKEGENLYCSFLHIAEQKEFVGSMDLRSSLALQGSPLRNPLTLQAN